jgi:hypothetical protein
MIPTQIEVVLRLAELSRLLDKATDEVAVLDEEAVRAKQTAEVAEAKAYLQADGSIDARKAQATVRVADQVLDAELAAAKYRACRERIRTLGVQIEVGRSMSAATRSQFTAEPMGQHT